MLSASQQVQREQLAALLASYAHRRPVRTVAVVGNAPLAPSDDRAREIDSADLVVRMNSLQLDDPGDPPRLGCRCHVVLLSRATRITPWALRDYRRRLYLVPQAGFTTFHGMRDQPEHWATDLGALPVPNGAVIKPLVDLLEPGHAPGSVIPTSGTICVYLAHELFPDAELRVTGLSFLDGVQQAEWAHQSGGSTAVNAKHHLDREGALMHTWIADGSLRYLP